MPHLSSCIFCLAKKKKTSAKDSEGKWSLKFLSRCKFKTLLIKPLISLFHGAKLPHWQTFPWSFIVYVIITDCQQYCPCIIIITLPLWVADLTSGILTITRAHSILDSCLKAQAQRSKGDSPVYR